MWLAILVAPLTSAQAQQDPITLLRDGQLQFSFRHDDNDALLRHYLSTWLIPAITRVSGQDPVLLGGREGQSSAPITVHVGHTAWVKQQALNWQTFGSDGYLLRALDANNIIIVGKTTAGTLIGINRFMEEVWGVYQLFPGDLGVVYEPRRDLAMPGRDLSYAGSPFSSRYWTFNYSDKTNAFDFTRWGHRVGDHVGHTAGVIFTKQKFAQEHPEYFALIDGQRATDGQWQPCLSNPQVLQIAADAMAAFLRQNPSYDSAAFSRRDGHGDCTCDACLAMDPPDAGDPAYRHTTDRWVSFCNQIAQQLQQQWPDKLINFYAYGRCITPPRQVQLHPNVFPYFTHVFDPAITSTANLERWVEHGMRHLGAYDYLYGQGFIVPRHYPHVFQQKVQQLLAFRDKHQLQHLGFRGEGYTYWPFNWLNHWVISRVLQDPTVDVDAEIERACRLFYRESAAPMRAFFDHCQATYQRPGPWSQSFISGFGGIDQLAQYTPDDLDRLNAWLGEAQTLARDPLVRQRIDVTARAFRLAELFAREYHAMQAMGAAVQDRTAAQQAVRHAADMLRWSSARREYLQTVKSDPLIMGQSDFFAQQWPKLSPSAQAAIAPSFSRISQTLAASAESFWEPCLADADLAPLHPYVRMQLALLRNEPAKVANANPQMLPQCSEATVVQTPEVVSDDMPPGWGRWHRRGSRARHQWVQNEAGAEGYALKMTGCETAGLVMNFPVTAGKLYRIRGLVRSTRDKVEELMIASQDQRQVWIWPSAIEPSFTAPADRWGKFEFIVAPDAKASFIGLVCKARAQAQDESIWYRQVVVEEY